MAVAHGQMDEGSLETVVLDFWERRYDVLVCTTIIESGIDMPTVNTLVVDRADLLGLGQLHQLRGRVGRGGQRAYAYLFHPADRVLSEQAYERLRTIGEHTELGSGFKIAMRDLEIRGAGNLLGRGPVGPHRRGRLRPLRPAGGRGGGRGEGRAPADAAHGRPSTSPATPTCPTDYVAAEDARLEAYRRLAVGDHRRPRWTTSAPSGSTASARSRPRPRGCWPWPGCGRRAWPGASARSTMSRSRPGGARRPGRPGSPRSALPASAQVRLRRLAPGATYREDLAQLLVPARPTGDAARRRRARRCSRS